MINKYLVYAWFEPRHTGTCACVMHTEGDVVCDMLLFYDAAEAGDVRAVLRERQKERELIPATNALLCLDCAKILVMAFTNHELTAEVVDAAVKLSRPLVLIESEGDTHPVVALVPACYTMHEFFHLLEDGGPLVNNVIVA